MVQAYTGVRQGCVLSPVLYALFINGLVRKLQSSKLGVPLNASQTLECLLYADDIVLLAENKTKLQALLDLVADYARKWRFELIPRKAELLFSVYDTHQEI